MATVKLLHHILAKRAQQLGPAMGPNQYVPSYLQQTPTSSTTPMNSTRPVSADVPAIPATPNIPPLPGMPSAPITSPNAGGANADIPSPHDVAAPHTTKTSSVKKTAIDPVSAGVLGGAAGVGTEMLLHHIISKMKKQKPGASAEPVLVEAADAQLAPDAAFQKALARAQAAGLPPSPELFAKIQAQYEAHKMPQSKVAMTAGEAALLGAGLGGAAYGGAGFGMGLARDRSGLDLNTLSGGRLPAGADPSTGAMALGHTALGAGAGALTGLGVYGAAALLKKLLGKRKPKLAADFTGEKVDPAFAKGMADSTARVNAQAAATVAKAKSNPPQQKGFVPKPIPGFGKNNSAKLADSTCYTGTTKTTPKTNAKTPMPRAALMKSEKKVAANSGTYTGVPGKAGFIATLANQLLSVGQGTANVAARNPKATGGAVLGLGATALGAGAMAAPKAMGPGAELLRGAANVLAPDPAASVASTATPPPTNRNPTLDKITHYFKGFAQNPFKNDKGEGGWTPGHWAGAAAGAVGAGMLLKHLLSKRKPEAEYEA